ncbi:MAG: phage terminase large subunit family protein [Blastocatellales bacterium]
MKLRTPWEQQKRHAWRHKASAQGARLRRQEILRQVSSAPTDGDQLAAPVLPRYEWAQTYRSIDDQPFTLSRFKPLEAIYQDDHPNICVMKPAQVGISEYAITYTIHAMTEGYKQWSRDAGVPKTGINVGYCFPTRDALSDFSKERFAGLKRESEYLAALFADSDFDDVKFKQVGDSYLYLRGAWSVESLLSFPADVLILDEFDRMDKAAIELVRKRLRQSVIKRQLCISTPTDPEKGIHALYLQSDQRVWEVSCANCGEYNELDYFRDVRADGCDYEEWKEWSEARVINAEWHVACPSCQRILDRFGSGRWTAQNPDAKLWHGYRVPALCFPSVKLEELGLLAISTDPTVKTEFYRSDLGIPFAPSDARVSEAMWRALADGYDERFFNATQWTRTTMGVDVGAWLNYRIDGTASDGRRYIRAMGKVRKWEELSDLMMRYGVRSCVVDAHPELHKAKEWAEQFKGRVRRAYYPNSAALSGKLFALGSSEERKIQTAAQKRQLKARAEVRTEAADSDIVQINRTMAMDKVFSLIADAGIICPPSLIENREIISQIGAPTREIVKDDEGQERAVWNHTAPDHYFHASVYALIALEVMPRSVPGILGQGSAKGWSPPV